MFPRVVRSFVPFYVLLWESPLLLRDVTREAVLEPWAVWCWFCVTAFTQSLIRLDNLSQPMIRRGSSGPASGSSLRELESDERRSKRAILHTGSLAFKQSDLDPPTGGCSNQCVRVGRSPASHSFSCKAHDHSSSDI